MKTNIIILVSLFFMLAPIISGAQNCTGVNYETELSDNKNFKKSLSQSFSIQKGESVFINQTFFQDNEYYISLHGNDGIGPIRLRILSKEDGGNTKNVLFDNASNNYKTSQNLIIKNTVPLVIEISAPNHDTIHHECLGIQIFFSKSI